MLPARVRSPGDHVSAVALEPTFIKALGVLRITPGAVGNARVQAATGGGELDLPVTGGDLTVYKRTRPTRMCGVASSTTAAA